MLILSEPTKDLGTIPNGTPIQFNVQLHNTSDKLIIISNIRPGCGSCTVSRVDNIAINPNATSTLTSTFTPSGLGANYKKVFIDYMIDNVVHNLAFSFNANVIN